MVQDSDGGGSGLARVSVARWVCHIAWRLVIQDALRVALPLEAWACLGDVDAGETRWAMCNSMPMIMLGGMPTLNRIASATICGYSLWTVNCWRCRPLPRVEYVWNKLAGIRGLVRATGTIRSAIAKIDEIPGAGLIEPSSSTQD